MLIRRDIRSFQDVNYNFQLIERMLRGHGLDGDQIREIPSDLITGLGDLAFDDAVEAAKLGETIIEGGYIKTGLVHASRIDVGALNADRIAARSITTEKITIGGVTTENLQDLLVTSAKLAFQAVISDKISTNAVHASHIIAGAITTPKIDAGAVNADKIQAGSISTYHITATGISANVITTGYMSADRLDAGSIDASRINVTNLNASNITAGYISADRIDGGTLSGVQIYVSTNAYVGDTLYLGLTSNSSGKTIRFSNAATISNMPVAEDIRISARAINLGGNVFSSGYIYFDTSKGVHLPTRNAGSGSRTTNEFTMPYWTGNMCYIDLGNDRIAIRDRWGILKGYINFD